MRGPNKMPRGNRPTKKGLNTNYIFPVTANINLDDYKWVCEQAKKLNISKAEVLRRCIRAYKGYHWVFLSHQEK